MHPDLLRLVTGAEMKEADRRAREEWGLAAIVLMENAATSVVEAMVREWGDPKDRRVLALCGKGGNGGDGLAIARHLANRGADVQVIVLAKEEEIAGESLVNLRLAQKMNLPVLFAPNPVDVQNLAALFAFAEWIVDAIYGVGGKPAQSARDRAHLPEPAATAVNLLNPLGKRVLAVDLPSGLDADLGALSDPTVRADLTVTLGLPKIGLFVYPGAAAAGKVILSDLGMPPGVWAGMAENACLLTGAAIARRLPRRGPESHKGNAGRVLIIGGSEGMAGAACLAAAGAARAGAGYVTLALPKSSLPIAEAKLTEVVKRGLPSDRSGALTPAGVRELLSLAGESDAVVLGPGLSRAPGAASLASKLYQQVKCPMVVDADALNAMAAKGPSKAAGPRVVTPHPGEAARLLKTTVDGVQGDRFAAAKALSKKWNAIALLKGARSVVSDGKTAFVNPTGGPSLATAGTGDVLAGVTGAFLAQGLAPLDAALAAAYVHGLAGDLAGAEAGPLSTVASDVAARIGAAMRSLQEQV